MSASISIIVPARNEATVIAATLAPWASMRELPQVIVVCNDCGDATATEAVRALPSAQILETETGGKAHAINLGLAAAPPGPVLIVDADVSVTPAALLALAEVLARPGVSAVSPGATFDTAGADAIVRGYYRAFQTHPYLTRGVGGVGVYGLSAVARARLGQFPLVLSDDDYVRNLFALDEQRRVDVDSEGRPVMATVFPPRRWRELVRTEARWRSGDAAARRVAEEHGSIPPRRAGALELAHAWRAGAVPLGALLAYAAVKLLGRGRNHIERLRSRGHTWYRDESSRVAVPRDA